jgi:streptogramin lyase
VAVLAAALVPIPVTTPAFADGPPVGTLTSHRSQISQPLDIAAGPDGALWFADYAGDSIGRISTAGVISVFRTPNLRPTTGITAGSDGNLWFSFDVGVGKITPEGAITTYGVPGGNAPRDIVAGPDGNIWFVNPGNDYIGRVTPAGVVTTFSDPSIDRPTGIAAGPDGNLWFTNQGLFVTLVGCPPCTPVDPHWEGSSIGRITPAGVVSSFGGAAGPVAITAGPDGNLWFTSAAAGTGARVAVGRITPTGTTLSPVPLVGADAGITTGPDGNVWVTGNNTVSRITPAGAVTSFATVDTFGAGPIVSGPDDNLWFTGNRAIVRMTPAGATTTFPGVAVAPTQTVVGPDGNLWFTNVDSIGRITRDGVVANFRAATPFQIAQPITAAPDGNLWFGYERGYGRVTTDGVITTFPSPPSFTGIRQMIAGGDGNVWFTGGGFDTQIGRITPDGGIALFPDPAVSSPRDLTLGADGAVWFVNGGSDRIGRISPAGVVTTFPAALTSGISLGPDGNLWFANVTAAGAAISRMTPAGVITTFTDPGITSPGDVVAGGDGHLWFTNRVHHTIGRITVDGVVTTFTGAYFPETPVPGPDGNLWFLQGSQGEEVARITPAGVITPFTVKYATGISPDTLLAGTDGGIWFQGAFGGLGRIQALPPDQVAFTAHLSAAECAFGARLAGAFGLPTVAPVARLGVDIFAALVEQGSAMPVASPPASDGPCAVTVTWPADQRDRIEATAAAWGVTPDQLHRLGVQLVQAIIYVLAFGGG